MKDLAQGLAALGRNGDSTLVHMQPGEVAGLQALAESQGTSLTINPHTGLPEAFSLGNMLTSLLPTAVGFMLGGPAGASMGLTQGTGWATAAPIIGGALTGAAIAGAKGEDPLMGGLTGGFGGYGGAGLAGKISAAATPTAASSNYSDLVSRLPSTQTAVGTPSYDLAPLNIKGPGVELAGKMMPGSATTTDFSFNPVAQQAGANLTTAQNSPTAFQSGLQNVMKDPMDFVMKNPMDVGMPVGSAVLAGLEPSDLYGKPPRGDEDKYDPYATLNLSGSTGLKLFADGGSVQSGGLRDLYGTSDNTNIGAISEDGYGIGRLNQLVNQTDLTKAQNFMYAKGGDVEDEGDNRRTASLPPLAMAALGRRIPNEYSLSPMALASLGMEIPNNYTLPPLAAASMPFYAKGGYLDGAGDGMSDSIPATIEDRQPARLADGEFVVPADVVSHIGNGSSKAGAKRLYAMLDRVREARTGTTKQGKEINPKKYMPV